MEFARVAALGILTIAAALMASCSQAANKPAASAPRVSPAPSLEVSPAAAVSPGDTATEREADAEFRGYAFTYRKDGGKTVASFTKRPLPRDGGLVLGAVRDVIARSYGDRADAHPRLVGSGDEQTIRLDTEAHHYIIVPIKSNTGDIHSLMITQLQD